MKKILTAALCFILFFSTFGVVGIAAEQTPSTNKTSEVTVVKSETGYQDYLNEIENNHSENGAEAFSLDALSYNKELSSKLALSEADKAALIDEGQKAVYSFAVEKSGFYNIALIASAVETGRNDILYSAEIDGKSSFSELFFMEISRRFKDESNEVKLDNNGNQIRPQIEQQLIYHKDYFKSTEGLYSDYFKFWLSEGNHTLTLIGESGKFGVKSVEFEPFKELPTYEEYYKQNKDTAIYTGKQWDCEAENMDWRSSASILSLTDMQSPYTVPYSASKTLMNTTGGANWKYPWDTISWKVNAPKDGLYRISIRFRQNYLSGMKVYRSVAINGEIPFKEAASVGFSYKEDWQVSDFVDYYVKLNKGENDIAMTVTLSNMSDTVRELQDILLDSNRVYREIVMLVGSSPDTNRDYNLDGELPNLKSDFIAIAKRIDAIISQFEKEGGGEGQNISILKDYSRQLKEVSKQTYTLTRNGRLSNINSSISALGAFISTVREQALEIDSFRFGGKDIEKQPCEAKFFDSVKHKYLRFISSFTEDYSSSGESSKSAVTVWLQGSGRDQMQILKNMIDDDFTPNSGIKVNLKLVASSLVHADFAGKGPDVALNNGVDAPINYALRGIATDLSCMNDFDEVIKRFSPDSMTSFHYKGKYYAIPETQNFDVMFCRDDVLAELGLKIPDTWDELVTDTLPVIRQNNLEIGIGTLQSIQTMTGYNIFTTLLYQNGGTIYEDDLKSSALDSVTAFKAFKKALSYYTEYKFPQSYDVLNRFRSGEMPIVMSGFTFCNNLAIGAPEINGLWSMYNIPGTSEEGGSVNRTQVFSSTASVILEKSKKKSEAWEFLKWWSSAKIQARYGLELEAVLGASGRYSSANVEAVSLLSWSSKQLAVIESQRKQCISLPQLPGSYFTSKAINNAFLSCVLNSDKLPREELLYWSEQIDLELERKRKEFEY